MKRKAIDIRMLDIQKMKWKKIGSVILEDGARFLDAQQREFSGLMIST